MSASVMMDCPFPDELISGFTTQGIPTASTPCRNSAAVVA
jgi:hypothetical protein